MRVDRNRLASLQDGLDLRSRPASDQTQRMLVKVFDGGAIPTTVPRVFLANPVFVDAADTEGNTPGYAVDSSLTVPVVVLGPKVPVAGDQLVAHAIGGRWLAELGAAAETPPTDCLPCSPCQIPKKDLRLTFTHIILGVVTTPLVFDGGGSWHAIDTAHGLDLATLSCSGGLLFFRSQGGGNDCHWPCSAGTNCLLIDGLTCDPFHMVLRGFIAGYAQNCSGQINDYTIDEPEPLAHCPTSKEWGCLDDPLERERLLIRLNQLESSSEDETLRAYVAKHGCCN